MAVPVAKLALGAAVYSIDQPYSYRIPEELAGQVRPGMRVLVPFGKGNRRSDGIVLSVENLIPARPLKEILAVLDEEPMLDSEGIRLALWMREQCFCTVYQAARAMLPAGLWFSLQDIWKVAPGVDREQAYQAAEGSGDALRVLDLLYAGKGSAEIGRIKAAFGAKSPNGALHLLQSRGILTLETSAQRGVGDKTEQVVYLAVSPEEALVAAEPQRRKAPQQYAVVELLAGIGEASVKEVCYFTGTSRTTVKTLEKKGLVCLETREVLRRPASGAREADPAPLRLNGEQQQAAEGLSRLLEEQKAAVALLYGVTGSGKTLVYLELIDRVLRRGRSAMVLVPEIALTPQLLETFTARFGDLVAILHSRLRAGERYDEWKRIRSGAARVVLGTRSAIFAPLPDLALIILDEEQESSYKSENVPRYHAREVAKYRCVQHNALLVLGSATPSVESMYQAEQGHYHLFTMPTRYNDRALPQVLITDMREELKQGNGTEISARLHQELSVNLERGEQSILLLNRRGASKMVTCGECGQVPMCPNCSVSLTYHSANHRLMCHYCGYSLPLPDRCPSCGGKLAFVGTGTQKVQQELEQLFPGVEILRMDTDTVSVSNSHEKLFRRFREEKIPILVGTQMVAKGLNFDNVTLVGVLAADQSLYADHFRAGERTFDLITQAVGRAGRGTKEGRALIQTMSPSNEVLVCAARQDYDAFYRQELEMRRLRECAPFTDQIRLGATGPVEQHVIHTCRRLRWALEEALKTPDYRDLRLTILGPAPATVTKVNNQYRYRLSLIGKNEKKLRLLLAHLLRSAQRDKENAGVSVHADLNPLD